MAVVELSMTTVGGLGDQLATVKGQPTLRN